ncbi:MAG TPA: NYN domain-containing protein [Steroidobacteraceae bacterium]|nr:NYN domain-containing protein [Steroidobacteraceae bacterium]
MKYAILIDAGFIKRKLGSQTQPLDAAGVCAFLASLRAHEALAAMSLHRVYWYDAPPLESRVAKPLLGGRLNFGATALARSNAALLAELCQVPFVSVRRGDLVFRGWKVRQGKLPEKDPSVTLTASDLEPNIHQKGVDMRLGLDIAALTLKAHVDTFVLVAGDSDFVPAMKFARREGAQVFLVTLGHPVRTDMFEHSDLVLNVEGARSPAMPAFVPGDAPVLDSQVNQ